MICRDEEENLIIRAKNKDEEALKCLIYNNIKYIKIEVFKITYTNSVVSYEDLISEGIVGLIKAVDRYDLNKNIKFITYAIWWIRQAILYYLDTNFWSIKVSNRTKVKLSQAEKDNLNSLVSIDDSDTNEAATLYLEDGYKQVENKIFYTELYEYIEEKLTKSEMEIIKNYYGIGCKPLTLLQIGRKYSISGERVRQIKKKAIEKIRQDMKAIIR